MDAIRAYATDLFFLGMVPVAIMMGVPTLVVIVITAIQRRKADQ